ncbi:MAG TPA: hypothetical protein VGJ28_09720 [Micromonosporaceae bacterium]|jgi:hypothetical protein
MTNTFWKRRASLLEVAAAAALSLLVWRLAMGWDWSTVAADGIAPGPFTDTAANTRHGIVVGAVAAVAIVWLALRGRAIVGAAAVFVPIVVGSGWRMSAARTPDASIWPVGLALLIIAGTAGSVLLAGVSAAVRFIGQQRTA